MPGAIPSTDAEIFLSVLTLTLGLLFDIVYDVLHGPAGGSRIVFRNIGTQRNQVFDASGDQAIFISPIV